MAGCSRGMSGVRSGRRSPKFPGPRTPCPRPRSAPGSELGGRDPTGSGAALPPREIPQQYSRAAPPRSGAGPVPGPAPLPLPPRCPKAPRAAAAPIPPGRARQAALSRRPLPRAAGCRAVPLAALPCHTVPCRRSPHARPHVGGRGSGAGVEGAAAAEPHVGWVGAASPAAGAPLPALPRARTDRGERAPGLLPGPAPAPESPAPR